jgi:hypothetical protein
MKVDAGGLSELGTAAEVARVGEQSGCDGVWSGEVSHDALLPHRPRLTADLKPAY